MPAAVTRDFVKKFSAVRLNVNKHYLAHKCSFKNFANVYVMIYYFSFIKDIFPDKATERKILSFKIKCSSDGCDWSGELREKEVKASLCELALW